MDENTVTQGAAITVRVELDDADPALGAYDGTVTLSATVWPGGNRPASFAPATAWEGSGHEAALVTITGTHTAALAPGRYQGVVRATKAGASYDAGYFALDVLPFFGTEAEPFSYITFDQLRIFASQVGRVLDDASDESGFAEQRHQASGEFDRWVLDRYNPQVGRSRRFLNSTRTGPGPYPVFSDGPNGEAAPSQDDLEGWLGTSAVIVTPAVVEVVARLSLSIIYGNAVGRDDAYRETGNSERQMATMAFKRCRVEIDTDDDGTSDIRVDQDVSWTS